MDDQVPAYWRGLGLPGLADIHVHFLPPAVLANVWAYFDAADGSGKKVPEWTASGTRAANSVHHSWSHRAMSGRWA